MSEITIDFCFCDWKYDPYTGWVIVRRDPKCPSPWHEVKGD